MTTTIQVPRKIPSGLDIGGLNGQRTSSTVISNIANGCYHLVGARKPPIPLFCSPRVITSGTTYPCLLRREFFSQNAVLYLTYSTYGYSDYWTLTLSDFTGVGSKINFLQPTSSDTVEGSFEVACEFDMGNGDGADHTLNSGNLDFTMEFTFNRRDDFFKGDPQQMTLYSAIIEVDDMTEITF